MTPRKRSGLVWGLAAVEITFMVCRLALGPVTRAFNAELVKEGLDIRNPGVDWFMVMGGFVVYLPLVAFWLVTAALGVTILILWGLICLHVGDPDHQRSPEAIFVGWLLLLISIFCLALLGGWVSALALVAHCGLLFAWLEPRATAA